MPKIFSEQERRTIIEDLRETAMSELAKNGIRKTTVDDICKRAHLAKGSFYLFYESKEELFLDCLDAFFIQMEEVYLDMLQNLDENHIVTSLTEVFFCLAVRVRDDGMFRFLDDENLTLIRRKVPEKRFRDVTKNAEERIRTLFSYFSIDSEEDIRAFESGYISVLHLFLLPQRTEVNDKTIKFLIRGLVLQMVE